MPSFIFLIRTPTNNRYTITYGDKERSDAVLQILCYDPHGTMIHLNGLFAAKYRLVLNQNIPQLGYASEHFIGDCKEMIKDISDYIYNAQKAYKVGSKENIITQYEEFIDTFGLAEIAVLERDGRYQLCFRYKSHFWQGNIENYDPRYGLEFQDFRMETLGFINEMFINKCVSKPYDAEIIFNDIFWKCITGDINIRGTLDHEFIITEDGKEILFDAKKCSLVYPRSPKICGPRNFSVELFGKYTMEEINTEIVVDILSQVLDTKSIKKFRLVANNILTRGRLHTEYYGYDTITSETLYHMCYNILIGKTNEYIFYELSTGNNLLKIENNKLEGKNVAIFIDSTTFGNNPDPELNDKVNRSKKLGYRNIIVSQSTWPRIEPQNLQKYMEKNIDNIIQNYMSKAPPSERWIETAKRGYSIFTSEGLLRNFVKWVCEF